MAIIPKVPARFLLRWKNLVSVGVVLPAVVTAGLILREHQESSRELNHRVHAENQLNLGSRREHVEELLGSVYSTILFISLDSRVQALNRESYEQIRAVIDYQYEEHRLAEVYVLKDTFNGKEKPFMTFERESDEESEDEHSLEREHEEYQAQIIQLARFAQDPEIQALISPEIRLCVNDRHGLPASGFVYSVPIRGGEQLVGSVAGMIPTEMVQDALQKGAHSNHAFLVNSWGEWIFSPDLPEGLRSRLEVRFREESIERFLNTEPHRLELSPWTLIWEELKVVSGQTWWVLLAYDEAVYGNTAGVSAFFGPQSLAASVLLGGLMLVLLVRVMSRRLEESLNYLQERHQLERDVQDAGEREQRRIGEILHEDLCQRLVGIELAGQALAKQLEKRKQAEAGLAEEIAEQARESLGRTRYLAGELHPVSLALHGFSAAVQELAAGINRRSGVRCTVREEGVLKIRDSSTATHVYRILQEILGDFVIHRGAKRILIELQEEGDRGILTISDDGDVSSAEAMDKHDMGLRIVRYRCELIGASFSIVPGEERGARVVCSFPLAKTGPRIANAGAAAEPGS